jgi:DNA repair exonuclease SbcCD ATPase subunit
VKVVYEQEGEVTNLIDRGSTVSRPSHLSDSLDKMQAEVINLRQKWSNVTNLAKEKTQKVSRMLVSAQEQQLESLEMWLNQVEISLEKWDAETEDWQRNYLKTVEDGVASYKPVISDSYLLVDMSAVTRKIFNDRIDKAKKRWETVDRLLNMKRMKLDRKDDLYSVYTEKHQSFVKELLQWEAIVQKTDDGNADKDELESFQRQKATVHGQLQTLSIDGQSYIKMHSSSEYAIVIQEQLDNVSTRWDIVCKSLEHGLIGISYGLEQVHELQGRLDELNSWMKGVTTIHLSAPPNCSSHENVEHELEDIKKLLSDISSRHPTIETLDRAAHQFASQHGAARSPKSLTRDERDADRLVMAVEELKAGWGQLCEGINQRNRELERVQVNFQRFDSLAGDLGKWMDEAEMMLLVQGDPKQDEEREHQLKSLKAAQRFHIDLLDNIEHLCREIVNQSSDAREVQKTRDSIKERWDDIDILLRERLAVFSHTSKESDSIMEQLSSITEWLNEAEPLIVGLVADKSEQRDGLHLDVQTRLQKVKTWITDATRLKQKLASITASGLILLPSPSQDQIKHQLTEAKDRLSDISDVLSEHECQLESSKKQIKEFEQQLDDLTGWTEASRKVLRGGKLKDDEESKSKLHAIEMEVEPKKEQVKWLSLAMASVTAQCLPQHASSLERKLDAELKEFNHVILWLAATWKEVEHGDVDAEGTRKEIDDLVEWLLELQKRIDEVAEKQGIEEQFQQCQAFLEELIAQKPKLSDMQRHVDSLISLSLPNTEQSQQIKAERQVVSDKYQEMYIALEGERNRLQSTMSFAKSLMDFHDWLSETESSLDGIAESPLGYGMTAGLVLEKCQKFQLDLKAQQRIVDHANSASQATFSAADPDFVDACRQKLVELNARHSSLCENVALLSQRLCEVSAFESRLEEFEGWLATMKADVSTKQMGKEERRQVLGDASDQGDMLEGVERLLGALEENIEEDSAKAYRERVEGLRQQFGVFLSVLRGDTAVLEESVLVESTKRHITFVDPTVTDINPSAVCQQAQYDSSAMEEAVAAMDDAKIKTLKKFEKALIDLGRILDVADGEFQGISSTSTSVDDMLAKCKHLQQNLQKQETPISQLKELSSTLISFCEETGHSQAAEVISDRLREQMNRYDELKSGTDAEHARLSQAAEFAQSILVLAGWVMETDGVLSGVEKLAIGCDAPMDEVLGKCKNLEQSLEQYRHTIEQVNESGEKVIPNLDPEVADVFQNKLQELNQQYRRLCSRTDRLSEMMEEVQSFNAKLSELTTWCDQMAQQVAGNTQQVTAAKALQSEILSKNADIDKMPSQCKDVTDQLSPPEIAKFEERTEALMRKYDLLKEDAAKAVDVAEVDVESFTEECQKLLIWIKNAKKFLHPTTEDVDELAPIGDDLEKCKTLGGELSDEETTMNHLAKSSKRLRESCTDKKKLEDALRKYSHLVKLYAVVKTDGPQRERFLEKAVVFERDSESMMSWLSQTLAWLENCKKSRMQQEQRQQTISMLKSNMEQQHPNCQSLLSSGESILIYAEFARATVYRDKLAMLREKWAQLEEETKLFETSSTMKAVEEEETKRQEAFSSAEESVEWLTSMLDQLKKQPPAAIDLDQLKKQIDDHMEFQENTSSRQPGMEDNKASLSALVDDLDIGEEAASLVTRLSDCQQQLSDKSKQREQELEKAMEVSKSFHDDVNDVLSWLEDVESRLQVPPRDMPVVSGEEAPGPREMCKVVREEIDQKYTVIQDLNSRMSHLVSTSGSQGAARLIQRIEELNQRYNDASTKSKDYLKGTEYRTLNKEQLMREMAGLKDWLQTIEKWLMMQRTLTVEDGSEDQQAAELELERCTNLLKDLSSRRTSVESIVESAHTISTSSDHNDEESAMLAQEADYLQKFFEDVKQRCAERQLELQSFIQQDLEELTPEPIQLETLQDVLAAVDDLKAWLDEVHSWLETQHPGQAIGEDISAIEKMLDLLRKCLSDLTLKQLTLNSISEATQSLTTSQTPKSQSENVTSAVASVSQSFGAVEQEVSAKIGVLEKAAEVAGDLQGAIEAFVTWLDETDALLDAQGRPAGDLEVLAQQLEKHSKLHSEVTSHQKDLNHIIHLSRPLIKTISRGGGGGGGDSGSSSSSHNSSDEESASDGSDDERDMSDLQVTIRELKFRYRDIGDKVAERQRSLEVAMQRLRDLCTIMQDLQFWMLKVDQVLMEKVEENNADQLQAQKESHRELVAEFEVKHDEYRHLNDSCTLFLADCMDVSSASLTKDLAVLNRQWSMAESKMRLRQSQLEVADLKIGKTWVDGNSQARSEFAAACLTVYSWLGPLEEQLLKPVMLHADLSVIQEHCEAYKAIQEQVAEHHHEIDQLNDLGDQAIHESASDSARTIEQDIEQVMERWEVICSLAPERLKEIESIQKQVQTFYSDVENLGLYLESMEENVHVLKLEDGIEERLVGPLQEFGKREKLYWEVKEMAEQLEEVSGATSAVALLKVKMMKLSDAWTTVEEKLGDLQEKILQREEFEGSLSDFGMWIEEAENVVDREDPPQDDRASVDEELHALQELVEQFDTRADQLETLIKISLTLNSCWANYNSSDSLSHLNELEESYLALRSRATAKHTRVASMRIRGQNWRETMSKLLVLLKKAEQLVETPVHHGCELATVQNQLISQKSIHREVLTSQADIAMVNETANEFQRPQLESMNRRWEAMRHGLNDRRTDLETAYAQLEGFYSDVRSLHQMMVELEKRIRSARSISEEEQLIAKTNECGSLLDKTDTTGHRLVDSSPTGSPAANTLQKALGQLTQCFNSLKELLQCWRADPAGVSGKSRSLLITDNLGPLVNIIDSPSPQKSQLVLIEEPDGASSLPPKPKLEDLAGVLSVAEVDLGTDPPPASDIDGLQEHLERFKNHCIELNRYKMVLHSMASSPDQSASPMSTRKADPLSSQLKQQYYVTCSAVEKRHEELASMHSSISRVHTHLQEIEQWLCDADEALDKQRGSGSISRVMQRMRSQFPGIQRRFETLMETIGRLCIRSEVEVQTDRKLRERVNTLGVEVDRIKRKLEGKRTSQLVTISPSAVTAFESDASRLLGWLDQIEVHVKTVSRDIMHEDSDVKDKQQQLMDIQQSLEDRRSHLDDMKANLDRLVSNRDEASIQVITIQKAWDTVQTRWLQVSNLINQRLSMSEKRAPPPERLQNFRAMIEGMENWLDKILSQLEPGSVDVPDGKADETLLSELKGLKDQMTMEEAHVDSVMREGNQLIELHSPGVPEAVEVARAVQSVNQRWRHGVVLLDKQISELMAAIPGEPLVKKEVQAVVHSPRPFSAVDSPVHFVVYADELLAWLDDLESCLTASLVVGEAQSITDSLNKIKAMENELEYRKWQYDHVIEGGNRQLSEYGETCSEVATVRSKKDQLTSRWDSVTALLDHRKTALEKLMQEWKDFSGLKEEWQERVQLVFGRLAAQVWDVTVQPVQAVKKQRQVVEVSFVCCLSRCEM